MLSLIQFLERINSSLTLKFLIKSRSKFFIKFFDKSNRFKLFILFKMYSNSINAYPLIKFAIKLSDYIFGPLYFPKNKYF